MRNKAINEGLSKALINRIQHHLNNGDQILLFINRRGYAPILMCHYCGWVADCKRCDAKMTLHLSPKHLHCHHCDSSQTIPTRCPTCSEPGLVNCGIGTERLEHGLKKLFPDARIARVDRDSTRKKGAMQALLDDVHSGKCQILIGTQMLAKGHHFPNVTLVGILDADTGLFSSEFRAVERMGQLLLQVSGRAGRAEKPGEVLIQTHNPEHPLLLTLLEQGYRPFSQAILQERQATCLPPYAHFALIRSDALDRAHPTAFLQDAKALCANKSLENILVLGPIPSPMEKRAGRYRAQLLIQSTSRRTLHAFLAPFINILVGLKSARKVRWSVDVDPQEMF